MAHQQALGAADRAVHGLINSCETCTLCLRCSSSQEEEWTEPRFTCERVCTSEKLLKKLGSAAKASWGAWGLQCFAHAGEGAATGKCAISEACASSSPCSFPCRIPHPTPASLSAAHQVGCWGMRNGGEGASKILHAGLPSHSLQRCVHWAWTSRYPAMHAMWPYHSSPGLAITPNTFVPAALDACTDACQRAVCVNMHHVPSWNESCLQRCTAECMKKGR